MEEEVEANGRGSCDRNLLKIEKSYTGAVSVITEKELKKFR